MERKLKHLEFLQAVINRLSNNSFLLKGWSVVLISGLFALAAAQDNKGFALYAIAPAVSMWGLDGYFLALERNYRALYDSVRTVAADHIDFTMTLTPTNGNVDFFNACFSKTLLIFHGAVLITIAGAISIL